jgi:integrase
MARFLAAFDDEASFRAHVAATRAGGKPIPFNAGKRAVHVAGSGRRPDSTWTTAAFKRFRWSKPLFVVALETGLSKSDLIGLEWTSVDLDRGIIRIHRQKTGVAATIPISGSCRAALDECRRRPTITPRVFLTDEKAPYSVSTFERHFKLAKTLAGIERRLRVHDLRHSFGCNLASEGVPTDDIKTALGHTTARMSERYARSAPSASLDRMKAALDRMSAKMSAHPKKEIGAL